MVFPSSLPLYQDPPTWNQDQVVLQQQQQQQQQLQIVTVQPSRSDGVLARPNSMADRARLAKIPQPEQPLKCPRCESTNTKFCYFNNYSLSQPRHFCKSCRRYWTRGGAMRNVPVGGGCRRNNKRNKNSAAGSSSKNSATADRQAGDSSATSAGNNAASFPFMSNLHPMIDYTSHVPNIGLGFSGIPSMNVDTYQQGNSTSMGMEQWRLNQIQQFPFLGGMESQMTQMAPVSEINYPFDAASSVKMEDNQRGMNLARQYNINLGASGNTNNNGTRQVEHYWNGGGAGDEGGSDNATGDGGNGSGNWMTNLSRFNTSSAEHLL